VNLPAASRRVFRPEQYVWNSDLWRVSVVNIVNIKFSCVCLICQDDSVKRDIISFIEEHNTPLVGQYGRTTKDKAYKTKRPLVLFFYTVDWSFEHRAGK
jgi:hypothetical protein